MLPDRVSAISNLYCPDGSPPASSGKSPQEYFQPGAYALHSPPVSRYTVISMHLLAGSGAFAPALWRATVARADPPATAVKSTPVTSCPPVSSIASAWSRSGVWPVPPPVEYTGVAQISEVEMLEPQLPISPP